MDPHAEPGQWPPTSLSSAELVSGDPRAPETPSCDLLQVLSLLRPSPGPGPALPSSGFAGAPEAPRLHQQVQTSWLAGPSPGGPRAPSAPRASVSLPPSSLHQPFAAPCHHRGCGQGQPGGGGRSAWLPQRPRRCGSLRPGGVQAMPNFNPNYSQGPRTEHQTLGSHVFYLHGAWV